MTFLKDNIFKQVPFLTQPPCMFYTDNVLITGVKLRMDDLEIKELGVYADFISSHKSEEATLCNRLLNSYSLFFRNSLTFAILEQSLLRNLVSNQCKQPGKEIRVWSAACAAGQEPYSMAILLHELREQLANKVDFRILATDMQKVQLEKAMTGSYQYEDMLNVSLKRAQKYFDFDGKNYHAKNFIKNAVTFELFDLLNAENLSPAASIFGSFDLVFCANLLFYYKPEYSARIMDRIKNNLNHEGILVAGDAEKDIVEKHGFEEVFPGSSAYTRCSDRKV